MAKKKSLELLNLEMDVYKTAAFSMLAIGYACLIAMTQMTEFSKNAFAFAGIVFIIGSLIGLGLFLRRFGELKKRYH